MGHSPRRGSPRKFAFQKSSHRPLRGSLRGSCGALRGSAGFSEEGDPMLVTLGNCWSIGLQGPFPVFENPTNRL